MFDSKKLKAVKQDLAELKLQIESGKKITKHVTINPVSGLISEINEYNNSLNYYKTNPFTSDMASVVNANPFVQSKLALKLNKALAFKRAFNYDGVKYAVTKYTKEVFIPEFKWREFAKQIAFNKVYGRSVIRVYWEDNKIVKTVGLNQALFTFNQDYSRGDIGDLMYNMVNLTKSYPYNFMTFFNEPDSNNPFGQSELKSLYPIVMFYNLLGRIEAQYFKKAVIPAFVASYESALTGDEAKEEATFLSNLLSQIENGSGLAIANLKSFHSLLENGQVNFNSTFERLANTISIRILGSDLTDSKKNGTYAQANAAADYIEGNVEDLATEVQDGENEITKWQIWAIFGTDYKPPRSIYNMSKPIDLAKFQFLADNNYPISFTLAVENGFPIPIILNAPPDDVWKKADAENMIDEKVKEEIKPDDSEPDNSKPDVEDDK